MERGVRQGVFPGAVLLIRGRSDRALHAFGFAQLVPVTRPMETTTRFDLASLTKALCTTTIVMRWVAAGKLSLDRRVAEFFPEWGIGEKADVTIRHLLCHASGLPDWKAYYREVAEEIGWRPHAWDVEAARAAIVRRIHAEPLLAGPGGRVCYSDLGFILLGRILERIAGIPLDEIFEAEVARPLGLTTCGFRRLPLVPPADDDFAATEVCSWRKRVLVGEVHDEHASLMGGIAGHAGLFGTAEDVERIVEALVQAWHGEEESFLPQEVVQTFWRKAMPHATWALGWDTPDPPARRPSSSGRFFYPNAVGHLGFTGTSVWIDLECRLSVILLTNRVHPSRENWKIKSFRPQLHDLVHTLCTEGA